MPGVRQTARVGPLPEGLRDRPGDRHPAEWHIPGVHALGEGHQVRYDAEQVRREPLTGPPEPGHDLVQDEDDPVLVAYLTHPGQIARRRHHDPRRARDRLQDDRGDRRRPLEGDRRLQVLQRPGALLLLGLGVEAGAVEVGRPEVHDPGGGAVGGPAARVAGEVHGLLGAAVVRAVRREHLRAARVQPGHAHRMLDGVGAAVGEEDLVEVPRRPLGDEPRRLRARLDGEGGRERRHPPGLLLDRGDDLGVLVADVGVDEPAGEVEVAVAVVVPEVRPLRAGDGERVDELLRGPGVEDMRTVRGLHGGAGLGVWLRGHAAEGKCPRCGSDIGVLSAGRRTDATGCRHSSY